MSRPVAHNKVSEPINGSIVNGDDVGNIVYTVDGAGNNYYDGYADRLWVPSAEGAAPIVFVTDTFTQGYTGDPATAVPIFFTCAGTSSAAIIYTANRLPGMEGQDFGSVGEALEYITRNGYFILEGNDPFEGINADSLAFDMDASKMSSYPQTGTTTYDLSGNIGQGSMNNGVSWVSNSGSFFFDGADDEIYVPNNTAINIAGTQQYTAMATVYPLLGGVTWHGIFSKGNNQQYALTINSPSAYLHYETNQGGISALDSAGGTVIANRWQHFVARFDGTNKTIWKNGEIIATQAASTLNSTSNTEDLRIGEGNNGENFRGEIQSVRVYRKSLTEAEIKQNYFGSPIVTDGLVFAVDANNIVSYPKSGTTWYNLTGSVTSGTLVNRPTFSQTNGGSISFDGVDDYVNTNSTFSSYINASLPITFEVWVYVNLSNNDEMFLGSSWSNGGVNFRKTGTSYTANKIRFLLFTNGSNGGGLDSSVLPSSGWYHCVGTYNGNGLASSSNFKLYVNGVEQGVSAQFGTPTTIPVVNNILLGQNGQAGSNAYLNGKIANTRIYNKALTASEVLQNYQAEQYRFGQSLVYPTNGLLLYLDAGDYNSYPGTGTTWYDLSGNGANATMFNGMETGWNSTGYFQLDGTDDYADSIVLDQEYRDLIIGLWSENTGGGLEMIFAKQGGADKSLRLDNNIFRISGTDANDWNYLEDASTFGDGVFGQAVDCSGGWHIIRGYRSNDSFGTTFRYSISSTFLSSARMYKGKLAFILSYNRKLSNQEVLQIYWYFSENKLPA